MRLILQRLINIPWALSMTHTLRNKYLSLLERISNGNPQRWHRHMQFHAEFGPAQFEVATGPLLPVEAIDALIYSQEAIRSIAFKHDAYATFHPKPLLHSEQMNSLHMHFSVESSDKEFVPDKFLAGLLKHL